MAGLFGMLLALGVLLWLLPWLGVVAVAAGLVWLLRWWMLHDADRAFARRDEAHALADRAVQQNQWYLAGDPRGVFGESPRPVQTLLVPSTSIAAASSRDARVLASFGSSMT
ncbi:hypothetical protein [Mycolicibacterium sp. 120270]|uniref:hypothetical protein n=1 Tax=Mycolicibacterium sp. 120270 TaxID=3090600 RepID=UPI00299F284B|nr:hypothetical protein [Mycolicibacterium sp. 120270]MDX1883045.1 hypothetical protein [Mycolicibacterium sp. 120270]